jgi:hypothetical protein
MPEIASKRVLEVPAPMLVELACGMEDSLTIANRYGYTTEEFGALAQWEPFRRQLEAKKSELSQSGYTFRLQNAFFAEDVGKDLYVLAKGNDIPFSQKLEAYKTFVKFADLEPKNQQSVAQGSGFSVVINFAPPAAQSNEIDVTPTTAPKSTNEPATITIPFAKPDGLQPTAELAGVPEERQVHIAGVRPGGVGEVLGCYVEDCLPRGADEAGAGRDQA